MYRFTLLFSLLFFGASQAFAFCGFYVSRDDAPLYNKSSQVIMVRDGNHTVITMSNDYQGDAKDFAMIVPVPTVLKRSDIRVVSQSIVDKLDNYTMPRLVEYHDQPPCPYSYAGSRSAAPAMEADDGMDLDEVSMGKTRSAKLKVKVKARYSIGEYDIVLLSAEESSGLQTWLRERGYKLPEGANEVLEPYIRDNMNFFVVKVDLSTHKRLGFSNLRPIQIQFNSNRFMLPIRLGMANAESVQDLVIYALNKSGKVLTTNYPVRYMTSNIAVPSFLKGDSYDPMGVHTAFNGNSALQGRNTFEDFYQAAFEKACEDVGNKGVFMEYSWNLSTTNNVKCDPCTTSPITYAEATEAGVWWLKRSKGNRTNYAGELHITRLHVRYDRKNFPQDLMFQSTPDRGQMQNRYIVHNMASGPHTCDAASDYLYSVQGRREQELKTLTRLTGWSADDYRTYADLSAIMPARDALKPGPELMPVFNVPAESTSKVLPLPVPTPTPVQQSRPSAPTSSNLGKLHDAAPAPAPEAAAADTVDAAVQPEKELRLSQPSTMIAEAESPEPESSNWTLKILLGLMATSLAAAVAWRFRGDRNS